MEFRFDLTVQVKHRDEDISVAEPVPVTVLYQSGRWRAQSQSPPVVTEYVDSMEEALVTAAKEIASEMHARVS
jgi:hypothetical protein